MFTTSPAPIVINKSPGLQFFLEKAFNFFQSLRSNGESVPVFQDFFGQVFRRDSQCIGFSCSINIGKNNMVCVGQGFSKFMEECFCPGVGVGAGTRTTVYCADSAVQLLSVAAISVG